jgi:hypothetical protein
MALSPHNPCRRSAVVSREQQNGAAFVIAPEQHHTSTLLGELARRLKPDTGRAPENRNAAVGDE